MQAHTVTVGNVVINKEAKAESREVVNSCPIMEKQGYSGKSAKCDFPKLKKEIPKDIKCCSEDYDKCLLLEVPGYNSGDSLLREINFAKWNCEELDEVAIKKQIVSFFNQINQNKIYS